MKRTAVTAAALVAALMLTPGVAFAATGPHPNLCITLFGIPFCGTPGANSGQNNNIGRNCPANNSIGCIKP